MVSKLFSFFPSSFSHDRVIFFFVRRYVISQLALVSSSREMKNITHTAHRKQLDCSNFAKEYFKEKLVGLKINDELTIEELKECDGDVTLGQRKSKCVSGAIQALYLVLTLILD